jgi:hypothetical protein
VLDFPYLASQRAPVVGAEQHAVRPGMVQFPEPILLAASSPYWQKGALYENHKQHFGRNGPILVWQAPTRTMNPTVKQSVVDRAIERDAASASSEWLAQFRTDIAAWIARNALQACISAGVYERPPQAGFRYSAFVDPSGGSSDSMTLAIAHKIGDTAILDCVREVRPPFSPEAVVSEFASVLKSYSISSVTGDRYAGEWVREPFRVRRIAYELSAMSKSEIYLAALPAINSGRVDLLDDARLMAQFCGLGRRTARGGRDSIDHAPGSHDDLCNAAAGVLVAASAPAARATVGHYGIGGNITWQLGAQHQADATQLYRDQAGVIRVSSNTH